MTEETTINHLLYQRSEQHAARIALKYKDKGRWHYYRWSDVLQMSQAISSYFLKEGLNPGDRVALVCNTRPEWLLADLATMSSQAVLVPIYPTLLVEDMEFIINDSKPKYLILENQTQIEKWNQIKNNCPSVEKVIYIDSDKKGLHWSDILVEGRELAKNDNAAQTSALNTKQSDTATILYTSGTTGKPKGVVLTHLQLVSEIRDLFHVVPINEKDLNLTFLPFSHILGRIEALGSIYAGYALGFAESIERIRPNILELKPSVLVAVPRIFEKLYAAILANVETKPTTKKLFTRAIKIARDVVKYRESNKKVPLHLLAQYQIFEHLVYSNIREKLGGNIRFCISGGAPLSSEIAQFFFGIGIPVYEGYGLTETTACITLNTPMNYKFGTVGQALPEVDLKIAEDGEITVRSEKVMREYYNNPGATSEVMDNGYFKTGDIGEIDSMGFLKITDRKKDLIKTAGGKYVAPQRLEGLLKNSPYVSNVLIHGDQKKYIVALITLDNKSVRLWAERENLAISDYSNSPEVKNLIKDAVANTNSQVASFESIKKFHILADDFSVENGELTPSLKVKRKVCDKKYKTQIDALYN